MIGHHIASPQRLDRPVAIGILPDRAEIRAVQPKAAKVNGHVHRISADDREADRRLESVDAIVPDRCNVEGEHQDVPADTAGLMA